MKFIKLIIALLLLNSCTFNGFQYLDNIQGNIYVWATDIDEDMSIGYKDGEIYIELVNATVFAFGNDKDFIIIKQHPKSFSNPVQMKITNYYIIDIRKNNRDLIKTTYGPYTKVNFDIKRKELGVSEKIQFSKVFKYLE